MRSSSNNHGEAGNRGEGVRSDCWVKIDFEAGPEIGLTSKVESYYGESIRALISDGLEAMGIAGAGVVMEDQGALPWVLAARLEAAARAASFSRQ